MAQVATARAGLPKYSPIPEFSKLTATEFVDHMALDSAEHVGAGHREEPRPRPALSSPLVTPPPPLVTPPPPATSDENIQTAEERDAALRNLLGSLSKQTDLGNATPQDVEVHAQGELCAAETQPTQDLSLPGPPADDSAFLTELSRTSQVGNNPINDNTTNMDDAATNLHPSYLDSTFTDPSAPLDNYNSLPQPVSEPTRTVREYEAFARLVFPDGNFYLNTYSCELGRDILAYKAAKAREDQAEEVGIQPHANNSNIRSRPSDRLRGHGGSQVQGSIVSEAGGFAGIDEEHPSREDGKKSEGPHHSSQASSNSGLVKPQEVLLNPGLAPFDYKKTAEVQQEYDRKIKKRGHEDEELIDDEQPAAVTADHLPDPNACPLIPIHATTTQKSEVAAHRSISRRHVRIQWNFDQDHWEMKILGRNGAFVNEKLYLKNKTVRLYDGDELQVGVVSLTFKLPIIKDESVEAEAPGYTQQTADHALPSIESTSVQGADEPDRRASTTEQQAAGKQLHKAKRDSTTSMPQPQPLFGPDGQPIVKRRGPGRPPKDGIMSTRERKEREKAAKMAEAKAKNGGVTPEPFIGKGATKTLPSSNNVIAAGDAEKRKYNKRKRDENGQLLPSIENDDDDLAVDGDQSAKKARVDREKSMTPEYPSKESLTAEQLARPTDPYAILLYKLLLECYPEALPLKQIYRRMKMKFPYFVHEVNTEGWQSSVRHNLNSEFGKYFQKGDKEGKGYAWMAIPGVQLPQQEKKRPAQPVQVTKPQRPVPSGSKPPYGSTSQQFQWQNTAHAQNGQSPGPNQNQWQQSGSTGQAPAGASVHQGGQMARTASQPFHAPNGVQPPPTPAIAEPRPTPSNMPCTLDGIDKIRAFEQAMYDQLPGSSDRKAYWQQVFWSAKRRCLHGAPGSLLPAGESDEERTILKHIQGFIEMHRNPSFAGFKKPLQRSTPDTPKTAAMAGDIKTASQENSVSTQNPPQPNSKATQSMSKTDHPDNVVSDVSATSAEMTGTADKTEAQKDATGQST